jgi:hypothetical protein
MIKDVKKLAEQSWFCSNISLSHLCENGNELYMWHDAAFDQLKFRFVDNSKPFYYKEAVKLDDETYTVVDKIFKDKVKAIAYDYPYVETVKPAKLVADTCGIFYTGDYTFVKENIEKRPDYDAVENVILKALKIFECKIAV